MVGHILTFCLHFLSRVFIDAPLRAAEILTKYPRQRLTRLFRNDVQGLVVITFLLVLCGLANVFSATYIGLIRDGQAFFGIAGKYGFIILVSSLLARTLYRHVRFKTLQAAPFFCWICLLLIGLFVLVKFLGLDINGSRRWLSLGGGLSLQPSEFAKLIGIWGAAIFLAKQDWEDTRHKIRGRTYVDVHRVLRDLTDKRDKASILTFLFWKFLIWVVNSLKGKSWEATGLTFLARAVDVCRYGKALVAPAVFAGFTIDQPDMGTAVLIVGFPLIMMILNGFWHGYPKGWLVLFVLGGAGILGKLAMTPYRWARIENFYDPWSVSQQEGYQAVQSIIAVGSGGLGGAGYAEGTAKFFYLPEAHTDFAFAVWSQEWGFVGFIFVLLCFLALAFFGFRIASACRDTYGKLLAVGCTVFILGQAFFNMLMVAGMLPVTGVPLPFISYGGSALFTDIMAVTAICMVGKDNIRRQKQENKIARLYPHTSPSK